MQGLPNMDFTAPSKAIQTIPSSIWANLPSAIIFGGIDVLTTYLHGYFKDMGYNGVLPLAFSNGLGDTAKFAYYNSGGMI